MKQSYLLLFLIFTGVTFALDRESLARAQFPNGDIPDYLRERVPFLNQEFENMNTTTASSDQVFEVSFVPSSKDFESFANIAGQSISDTKFVASWYTFNQDSKQAPRNLDEMLKLLNTKKPIDLSQLSYANNQWTDFIELKNTSHDQSVYVFISMYNKDGILLPLTSGAFYQDHISGVNRNLQMADLNLDVLSYWAKQGYLQ
ncbi:MAG: hypothetical protein ACRCS8_01990 [Brevinema sp.]